MHFVCHVPKFLGIIFVLLRIKIIFILLFQHIVPLRSHLSRDPYAFLQHFKSQKDRNSRFVLDPSGHEGDLSSFFQSKPRQDPMFLQLDNLRESHAAVIPMGEFRNVRFTIV